MAKLLGETGLYFVTSIFIAFLLINFDLTIGTIYSVIIVLDLVFYYIALDSNYMKFIPLEKPNNNRYLSVVWALGAFIAFYFLVSFVSLKLSGQNLSGFDAFSKLVASTFSSTPILAGSTYMKIAVWGILIAKVETSSFFRTFLHWGVKVIGKTNLPTSIVELKAIWIALVYGAVFALFHLLAKGIKNNTQLSVTFLFGFVSVILILMTGQVLEAIFLHVINNTNAVMASLGIPLYGAAGINMQAVGILVMVILTTWFLLFLQFPIFDMRRQHG